MESINEAVTQALGGEAQAALARQLGVDDKTAGELVQAAVPTILAGSKPKRRQARRRGSPAQGCEHGPRRCRAR